MMTQLSTKRTDILEAATCYVLAHGAARLTLDAVAKAAKVSKGGLLYHFPSKEALLIGMIDHYFDQFEAQMQTLIQADTTPRGRWLRAYVRATFAENPSQPSAVAASFAAIASDLSLREHVRAYYTAWQAKAAADGVRQDIVSLVMFATEGLWYAELFGFAPLDAVQRSALLDRLLALIAEG